MKNLRKKCSVCGFIDLEKVYDRVNREALRSVDVEGKLLRGIKSMYVVSQ